MILLNIQEGQVRSRVLRKTKAELEATVHRLRSNNRKRSRSRMLDSQATSHMATLWGKSSTLGHTHSTGDILRVNLNKRQANSNSKLLQASDSHFSPVQH